MSCSEQVGEDEGTFMSSGSLTDAVVTLF
jgi:hypothetical protein